MIYLFIILFAIILIFIPAKIIIEAKNIGENGYINIKCYVLFIRIFQIKINYINFLYNKEKSTINYNLILDKFIFIFHKKNEKKQRLDSSHITKISKLKHSLLKFMNTSNIILKKTYIKKFKLYINIGLDDAALTAIITGFLSGFINMLLSGLSYKINILEMPSIDIKPAFNETTFHFEFFSIFSTNLGNIIIGRIKFFDRRHVNE